MSTRRSILLAGSGALAAAVLPRAAMAQHGDHASALPHPRSLAGELAAAVSAGKALIVMVSLERCPWCRIVREHHLAPMRAEGQPVVQIELNRSLPVADFHGAPSTHMQVVRALEVRVAPTVLFFGRGGREVASRIAGMPLPDFYAAYLQDRVEQANRAVV